MIQFDKTLIIDTLDSLGVSHTGKADRKGWLSVLCPFHNDKNFGSAGVNLRSGILHCFSCGHTTNLIGIVKHVKSVSGQDALKYLNITDYDFYKEINNRKVVDEQKHIEKVKNKPDKFVIPYSDLILEEFDPQDYEYTRLRGFTKQFLKDFNIKLCTGDKRNSNRYKGYMITPVVDEMLDIDIYEARKLYEYERLKEYYNVRRASEDELRDKFKQERKEHRYNIDYYQGKPYVITREGEQIDNDNLLYLVRPKVLYPSVRDIDYTIFNREYLDINSDLYIVEGAASLPKTIKVFGSNVTAVFGSNLSDEQIQILSKFKKRIIVIPDGDIASLKMIEKLNNYIDNVYVIDKTKDDKEYGYEHDIRVSKVMDSLTYLVKKSLDLENVSFT